MKNMLETYLKKMDVRITPLDKNKLKSGENIRVNMSINKGINSVSETLREMELTIDLHAIQGERQFFQLTATQVGRFGTQAQDRKITQALESEYTQQIFPHLKKTIIEVSQKTGFDCRFFDQIDLDRVLYPQPQPQETNQTKH